MSNKTLSTGTLSLRFMQNALRRQQFQEVELERAEVKDEGKWEVGQDIKEAWGIEQGTRTNDGVAYETSYLPFLFSHEDGDTANPNISKPVGRRVFDKNGRDVSKSQTQVQAQVAESGGNELTNDIQHETEVDGDTSLSSSIQTSKPDEPLTKGRKFKVHAKPTSISSVVGKGLKGFDTWDQSAKAARKSPARMKQKSAREAIFGSMSGVGSDLRSTKYTMAEGDTRKIGEAKIDDDPEQMQKQQQPQPHGVAASKGFLKPAGVDEPASKKASSSTGPAEIPEEPVSPDIINGARKKRPRDQIDGGGTGKKKIKKKRSKLDNEPAGLQ